MSTTTAHSAHYNMPKHESGDTFNAIRFTLLVNEVAKDLTGCRIEMKADEILKVLDMIPKRK
jgi:hypothetical protein